MPANFISQPIPMLLPSDGTLLVTRDDAAGTVNIAIGVGQHLSTFKLGVEGWRGLSAALGIPPAREFVPAGRTCLKCGRGEHSVRHWAAANMCMACMPPSARPKGDRL
jgi:hypothetical protein